MIIGYYEKADFQGVFASLSNPIIVMFGLVFLTQDIGNTPDNQAGSLKPISYLSDSCGFHIDGLNRFHLQFGKGIFDCFAIGLETIRGNYSASVNRVR